MEPNHVPGYRPGDLIIDRYIPNATSEQREEARAALLKHALLLIRWGERVLDESAESTSSTSLPERRGLLRCQLPAGRRHEAKEFDTDLLAQIVGKASFD